METYAIRLTAEQVQILDCILATDLGNAKAYYRSVMDVSDSNDKLRASTNMAFSNAVDDISNDLYDIRESLGLTD